MTAMRRVEIPYQHDSADLAMIYLAVGDRRQALTPWLPAFRDTIKGKRVVWAEFDTVPAGVVTIWVRDAAGDRATVQVTL